jgi:hypothetical protein
MKASELRIGNWYDHNGILKQATPNTIEEVWESERSWCKPIPLTEEWLLKFGFELVDGIYVKYFDGNDFIGIDSDDFSVGTYAFGRIAHAPQPTFMNVHQLQNLYFALTGEEL